ncbi:MAG TPA: energy-coupling factor transporter transmembrane component T [Solirubrobacteraceae bacterium]|nr:energy-coupling factor transporter transmembrane component T [Solirubrobacteraceae bacterium]
MIGSSFFYRRLASPLHATRAGIGALWAVSLIAAALILYNPLTLIALLLGVLGAGWGAGVGRRLAGSLRTALIVGVPIVLVNVLVDRQGLTVYARLGDLGPFGQGDLTLEAVVYGGVIALKLALLILATTLAGLAVDPDALLRGVRRFSFRSALTATLAIRMLPLLAADSRRLAEAQRTRPGGSPGGTRARVALVSAVVAGSLDRAMDVAATLEVRGLAAPRPAGTGAGAAPRQALSRHDLAFTASAVAVLALSLVGRLTGAASFVAYPQIQMSLGAGTLAICAGLLVAVLLPFCDRRGIDP